MPTPSENRPRERPNSVLNASTRWGACTLLLKPIAQGQRDRGEHLWPPFGVRIS